jgi:integrase
MRSFNYVLKPLTINNAKPKLKRYALTDGGGLLLEIQPSGVKTWRFRYHLAGKREKVTIGIYPFVSIKMARDRHEQLREMVEQGRSPAQDKQAAAVSDAAVSATPTPVLTFRMFALTWVDDTLFHRAPSYRAQILRWLDTFVYPSIGSIALVDVMPAQVLDIIEKLTHIPSTAERVRVVIQQIFAYAVRKLLITTNPAALLKGAVIVPKSKHHRHLNEVELGRFWRLLDSQGAHATTIIATKMLMLTMVRKMELLRATWSEFDRDNAVWNIPAARMKMDQPHRVFLSTQVLALLDSLWPLTGSRATGYLFPTIFRRSTHMAEVTLNHFFRRLDFCVSGFSPHGTRSTAATLLREHGFGRDAVELLLAHAEANSSVAAYSHMELASERRRAMQFLADRIEQLASGADVTPSRS